jgi:dolichol-phosphate mannosyltransferase
VSEPRERSLISIVVPCYNESAVFPELRGALVGLADSLCERHAAEIVLVDDGSRDGTWSAIATFAEDDDRVRGVALSRNFGHQAALTCGYDLARGDAIVCMDADLQDPPEVVLQLVQSWEDGADIVFAIRNKRAGESAFKLMSAAFFYRAIRMLGATQVRPNTGDFRLMSRRSLDALRQMGEHHRFIRGMVGWVGFRTAEVHYDRQKRAAGETKYPFRKMLAFAIDATVSFSIAPLRFTFAAATCLAVAMLTYVGYAGVRWLFFGANIVDGWPSTFLAVTGFGVLNLVCLGILGEYVGRIFEQVKARPLYLLREDTGRTGAEPANG